MVDTVAEYHQTSAAKMDISLSLDLSVITYMLKSDTKSRHVELWEWPHRRLRWRTQLASDDVSGGRGVVNPNGNIVALATTRTIVSLLSAQDGSFMVTLFPFRGHLSL
jgi:hypothetical protein